MNSGLSIHENVPSFRAPRRKPRATGAYESKCALDSVPKPGAGRRLLFSMIAACAGAGILLTASACSSSSGTPSPKVNEPAVASPSSVAERREPSWSIEAWTFEDKPGKLLQSDSYRIFTTTERPLLLERLPAFLELALEHYTSALGPLPRPAGQMESFLFANRPQWARMTQREMGDQADVYLQIQRGGFAARGRAILYDIGPMDTFAIAGHEGWHQYTQRTFKDHLPVWLEEGVATYMEGFRWESSDGTVGSPWTGGPVGSRPRFMPWCNLERFEMLRRSVRSGSLMSLQQVTLSTPQELMSKGGDSALVFYAQAWAAVHFLNEGGNGAYRAAFKTLLTDASNGGLTAKIERTLGGRAASMHRLRRPGVDILQVYTGKTAEQLDAEYQEFITQVVKVGARQQIVQGKSPLANE
jgi:hypothetical protein